MKDFDWIDIAVSRLIGDISSHGDSERDSKVIENLKNADAVLTYIVDKLVWNMHRGEKSYEASVEEIGKRSAEILKNMVEMTPY